MVTITTGRRFLTSVKNAAVAALVPPQRTSAVVVVPVRGSGGEVSSGTGEPITHTGHVFDEKDPRRARFVGRQKEVNRNFAINLVAEEPVRFVVAGGVACCDGGGGALGHPRVYINVDNGEVGTCGYCGLRFKQGRAEQPVVPQKHHHQLAERSTFGALKGMATKVLRRLFCSIKDGVSLFSKMFVRFKSHKK